MLALGGSQVVTQPIVGVNCFRYGTLNFHSSEDISVATVRGSRGCISRYILGYRQMCWCILACAHGLP